MKRKNKIFRKVIIVLAVLALLTGCAGQEPEAEDTRTPPVPTPESDATCLL